jgi:hypothetical protein
MHEGRIVFSQLLDFFPKHEFDKCVQRYGGNHRVRNFSCLDQFLSMTFAQLTGRESLRDIATCLRAMESKLYHAGFRGKVSRSTLADANESRGWRIFHDLAQVLIVAARNLYAEDDFGVELDHTVYALDSTTVDLCLSLFPWAKFRKRKGAVKLHTLLDLRGSIPTVVIVTHGKVHDVNVLDDLILEAGAIYIMDRGYLDFARLYAMTQALAFFVTRAKSNFDCRRLYSRPIDKSTGLRCDQTVVLAGFYSNKDYPCALRRIRYVDLETGKRFTFLTNNFTLPALTIAKLYRCRWRVELFFKWIKQHLRIKAFYGTSENAVKTQIWIAISVYVLVAIVRKRLHLEASLYTILQILSVALFEKTPILQALSRQNYREPEDDQCKQLDLFDF